MYTFTALPLLPSTKIRKRGLTKLLTPGSNTQQFHPDRADSPSSLSNICQKVLHKRMRLARRLDPMLQVQEKTPSNPKIPTLT